jgi:tRNA wybutosine-synthesizing protein 1
LYPEISKQDSGTLSASIPATLRSTLEKQKYHLIGNHSAVKGCKWFHEALVNGRSCYKQKFYGIKSHQCIQMTPSLFYCTQQCLFCWRPQKKDLQIKFDETTLPNYDEPEIIAREALTAQSKILTGYKGNDKTDFEKLREAQTPKHVAISLTGEPTLYQPLGQLIKRFRDKGLTTFLVSNGTMPSRILGLDVEPTQLYISCCASNKRVYDKICRPQVSKAWQKLNETLNNLPNFQCPTVIRITLVKGINMDHLEDYARIINRAEPTYIETKAYMHVGFSSLRLGFDRMPSHKDITSFATRLAGLTSYNIVNESEESRVVLLCKRKKP